MKHFLPCTSCESQFVVTPTDAGRELLCQQCGAKQTAPSLGSIKRLPVAEEQKAVTNRKWSTLQGLTFGAGLVMLVAGSLGLYYYYPIYTQASNDLSELLGESGEMPNFADITPIENNINAMNEEQLWNDWRQALRSNTDVYIPTEPRRIIQLKDQFFQSVVIYGSLALAGLVAMFASFLLP